MDKREAARAANRRHDVIQACEHFSFGIEKAREALAELPTDANVANAVASLETARRNVDDAIASLMFATVIASHAIECPTCHAGRDSHTHLAHCAEGPEINDHRTCDHCREKRT